MMTEIERKQMEKQCYIIGLCLPCMGAVFFLTWKILPSEMIEVLSLPCMFYRVTGLYCPGCGGTRAVSALLKGEILLSVFYHPIVVYVLVIYLWYMLSHTIEFISKHKIKIAMRWRNLYLWMALVLVVINIAVKDIALTAFDMDILQILDRM